MDTRLGHQAIAIPAHLGPTKHSHSCTQESIRDTRVAQQVIPVPAHWKL